MFGEPQHELSKDLRRPAVRRWRWYCRTPKARVPNPFDHRTPLFWRDSHTDGHTLMGLLQNSLWKQLLSLAPNKIGRLVNDNAVCACFS